MKAGQLSALIKYGVGKWYPIPTCHKIKMEEDYYEDIELDPLYKGEFEIELEEKGVEQLLIEFMKTKYIREKYSKQIKQIKSKKSQILKIEWIDIITVLPGIAQKIDDQEADTIIKQIQKTLTKIYKRPIIFQINSQNSKYFKNNKEQFTIIREFRDSDIDKLVITRGIISTATVVYSKLDTIQVKCDECETEYHTQKEKKNYKCRCGKYISIEKCKQQFLDEQAIVIQERIQDLKEMDQPKDIRVYITGPLTDKDLIKDNIPGNQLEITGFLRREKRLKSNFFTYYIEANQVRVIEQTYKELQIKDHEIKEFEEFAKKNKENTTQILIDNIAPEIYGEDEKKAGLLLCAFGGVTTFDRAGKMKKNGNIHLTLIGDPGVGKTTLAKWMMKILPKCGFASGSGSTVAGLTATVQYDEITRTWVVMGGALVLNNGGHLIIDEMDKAEEKERRSLHTALSDGIVPIHKAQIRTILPANTTLIALLNPKGMRFDTYEPLINQINIDSALLSRLTFIFIFLDKSIDKQDRQVAKYMLGEEKFTPTTQLKPEWIKKYIGYARQTYTPKLSKEAKYMLEENYILLRNMNKNTGTIPVTARYLSNLMKVSEAYAKSRLSKTVDGIDVEQASKMIFENFKTVATDPETGNVDIDYFSTGVSSQNRNMKSQIMSSMHKLQDPKTKELSMDELIDMLLATTKIERYKIEEIIQKGKKEGEWFEPKPGKLRLI